jgi:hypothetical protein
LNDALWVEEIGFIAHNGRFDPDFPDRTFTERKDIEKTLRDSGKLPDLGLAPIASWYLARLAYLCRKRFPHRYGQILGSDGADYWLRIYCLKRPATVMGVLHCSGRQTEIRLSLQHHKSQDAAPILDKFIRALLQSPAELARCKVIVQYTNLPILTSSFTSQESTDGTVCAISTRAHLSMRSIRMIMSEMLEVLQPNP